MSRVSLTLVPVLVSGLLLTGAAPALAAPLAPAPVGADRTGTLANCIKVARSTFQVTGGNLAAAITAFRNVGGCGAFNAAAICSLSQRPGATGAPARAIVRTISGGKVSVCYN